MTEPRLESSVRSLRRRASLALAVRAAGHWSIGLVLALASLALLARGGLEWSSARAAWLLLPAALVPLAAWWTTRRRAPSDGDAAAWLDLRARAGGLLLTLRERPDERWAARAAERIAALPEPPPLGLARFAPRALGVVVFALAALFVPLPRSSAAPPTAFFERLAGGLTEQLMAVAAGVALDPELEEELTGRVRHLTELAARAEDGEGFLEAFDALSARIEEVALAEGARLVAADGALARLAGEALAEPERAARLLESSRELLGAVGALDQLPPELRAAIESATGDEGVTLPVGELLSLAGELVHETPDLRAGLRDRLEALRAADLLGGLMSADGLFGAGLDGEGAGSGAPGGGGAAPLRWSEELRALTERLADRALPSGAWLDPRSSAPVGVQPTAPATRPSPESAGPGSAAAGEQRAAWRRELAPRHRAAVQRFFQPSPRSPR